MLGALARGAKDGALSMLIKSFVNEKFGMYGEVSDVAIDSKNNKLVAQVLLKGERERVTATIDRYDIERVGEEHFIVLKRFSSSREWLTLLLNRFLKDKRYKLPAAVSKFL